jgi:hypothetical protein
VFDDIRVTIEGSRPSTELCLMSVIRGRLQRCLSRIESKIYALASGISLLPDFMGISISLSHMVNWGKVGLRKYAFLDTDWGSRSGLRTVSTVSTCNL